jgi:Tol biopolymer transport system component
MKKWSLFGVIMLLGMLMTLAAFNNTQAGLIGLPNKIFFTSYRDGNAEIYSMKPDGSSQTRLTNNAAYDGQPSCLADTNKFVFVSNRAGNKEL